MALHLFVVTIVNPAGFAVTPWDAKLVTTPMRETGD
jgi:hypothetical protein